MPYCPTVRTVPYCQLRKGGDMDATGSAREDTIPAKDIPPDIKLLIMMRGKGYAGISELAKDAGIALPTVSRILRGYRYEEARNNMRTLAKCLGITMDDLDNLIIDMRAKGRYLAL